MTGILICSTVPEVKLLCHFCPTLRKSSASFVLIVFEMHASKIEALQSAF